MQNTCKIEIILKTDKTDKTTKFCKTFLNITKIVSSSHVVVTQTCRCRCISENYNGTRFCAGVVLFLPVCLRSTIRCLLLLFQTLTAVAAVDATKIAFHNINEIMEQTLDVDLPQSSVSREGTLPDLGDLTRLGLHKSYGLEVKHGNVFKLQFHCNNTVEIFVNFWKEKKVIVLKVQTNNQLNSLVLRYSGVIMINLVFWFLQLYLPVQQGN